MKHKKKNAQKWTQKGNGNFTIIISQDDLNHRNKMHFEHQLHTHTQIIELKKYKKEKHKKDYRREEIDE